ncbi:HAD family hydrolase [Yinghuangia seranimata]|uniref:HAD family hydrolase n=1 Tax=Yinghuangia seranimata TaxID=408067 RepID=UPI00248B3F15|nr:HAD family phosphatase [Yinghuangia seranimata]MDI2132915.1 HAD family phosphatase [Yinghuangia seranimata]
MTDAPTVRPGLVIFDNDGVLVDSEPLANRVLGDLLTSYGIPTTTEEAVHDYMGGSLKRVRDIIRARHGRELPDDFEDAYHAGAFAAFRAELAPVPAVDELLDALDAAGIPYCVASSGSHERIRVTLGKAGFLDRFADAVIFSSADVAHGKPAPDLFLLAAEKMGVAPGECVVVEDSPLGVEAARAAGMRVYGHAAMTPRERLADADAVCADMTEVRGLLGV